jgi:hypothetical protein
MIWRNSTGRPPRVTAFWLKKLQKSLENPTFAALALGILLAPNTRSVLSHTQEGD